LTSAKIKGQIYSSDSENNINSFISKNKFDTRQSNFIKTLFNEATHNNFIVQIQFSQ
jgi:hypothetical protein